MAVDFSLLPIKESTPAESSSRLGWAITLLLTALVGVLAVVLLWPKGVPTYTWKFWTTLVLFPAGISAWIALRRWSVHEGRKLDVDLRNEVIANFNETVFRAASTPLTLLGVAYRVSATPEENSAEAIRNGVVRLRTQNPIATAGEPVSARWLVVPGMQASPGSQEDDRKRHHHVTRWLFGALLDELSNCLQSLPAEVPLIIQLAISNAFTPEQNKKLWLECWHARSLRHTETANSIEPPHLMSLDLWLDEVIRSANLHARLVIAVQLHPLLARDPPAGASEAGAGVLLLPDQLSRRHKISGSTSLHRPVRSSIDQSGEALSRALKWADLKASEITGGWQTGLNTTQENHWGKAAREHGLTAALTNLDQTVGDAGVAAPWLAVACAATSLASGAGPQMVLVSRDSHIDGAVLKPASPGAHSVDRAHKSSNEASGSEEQRVC